MPGTAKFDSTRSQWVRGDETVEYDDSSSFQVYAVDLKLGGAVGGEGKKLAPFMGNVIDLDTPAALTAKNIVGGVIGAYSITAGNGSTYPTGAVLAQISDGVDDDTVHGVTAYIDGDSARTRAGAAFKVMHNNSTPGSGFAYGLDLFDAAHDGYNAVSFRTAHVRLGVTGAEDVVIAVGDFADGADSGFAPGSIGLDTTNGLLFVSDSSGLWQQVGLA